MDSCVECKLNTLCLEDSDSLLVCVSCGTVQPYIRFVRESNDIGYGSYTKVYNGCTYFKRVLRCLQDKSNSTIPEHIIKEIIDNPDQDPKLILSKYKLFHLYILLPHLHYIYRNKKPVNLSENEEELLLQLFSKVDRYIRNTYPERSQILRYNQILKKLLIIINREDVALRIPDLKTKKARNEFNRIWNNLLKVVKF